MVQVNSNRLQREDWVNAAFAAFEKGGVTAVKADPLAKSLGVTRGSFYWHFKNVSELMQAVLTKWKTDQTDAVIAANEREGGTAGARLLRLLKFCAADDGGFEMGIRSLMQTNANIEELVASIDETRMAYMTDLMVEMGKSRSAAARLSPVIYAAWLGEYSGAVRRSADHRMANAEILFELVAKP